MVRGPTGPLEASSYGDFDLWTVVFVHHEGIDPRVTQLLGPSFDKDKNEVREGRLLIEITIEIRESAVLEICMVIDS
jgi:hypothetical protein